MIGAAIRSEFIKLTTVRSTRWTLIAASVAGLLIVILTGVLTRNTTGSSEDGFHLALAPFAGVGGIPGIATIISAVLGALAVTSEIRFSTLRTTFLAVPARVTAIAAKTIVIAVVCAVVFFVVELIAVLLFTVLGGGGPDFSPFGVGVADYLTMPVIAAIAAVIGLAVGAAVRNAAAAITLLLAYMMVVEGVLYVVPQTRPATPYLPMSNVDNVLGLSAADFLLPGWVSLIYLVVLAGLLWAGATALLTRRDA